MKKIIFCFFCGAIVFSCNSTEEKTPAPASTATDNATKVAIEMPYTPSYSSSWSDAVSDEDLKTVLMSYKDWETGNMAGLLAAMADTVDIDVASTGEHLRKSNADLMKYWTTNRDSLSSVKISMDAWHKMFSTDKKDTVIVTWYSETDTYKNGKVDSAYYHDINMLKKGKIVWYSQYKRPKK